MTNITLTRSWGHNFASGSSASPVLNPTLGSVVDPYDDGANHFLDMEFNIDPADIDSTVAVTLNYTIDNLVNNSFNIDDDGDEGPVIRRLGTVLPTSGGSVAPSSVYTNEVYTDSFQSLSTGAKTADIKTLVADMDTASDTKVVIQFYHDGSPDGFTINPTTVSLDYTAAASGSTITETASGGISAGGVSETVVTAPEVAVEGNSVDITDGDATPASADHTDFGTATENGTAITRTFTINNTGDANLTVGTVTIPTGYTLVNSPSATVAPAGSTTFDVRLDTSVVGVKSGEISIVTNDNNENPFNFAITGTVISEVVSRLIAIENKIDTLTTELALVLKSGEEFTSTGNSESHDVTFTRKV